MAAFESVSDPRDPRAARILAKSIYRELRATGFGEREVMAVASELISLVTADVRDERESDH